MPKQIFTTEFSFDEFIKNSKIILDKTNKTNKKEIKIIEDNFQTLENFNFICLYINYVILSELITEKDRVYFWVYSNMVSLIKASLLLGTTGFYPQAKFTYRGILEHYILFSFIKKNPNKISSLKKGKKSLKDMRSIETDMDKILQRTMYVSLSDQIHPLSLKSMGSDLTKYLTSLKENVYSTYSIEDAQENFAWAYLSLFICFIVAKEIRREINSKNPDLKKAEKEMGKNLMYKKILFEYNKLEKTIPKKHEDMLQHTGKISQKVLDNLLKKMPTKIRNEILSGN